MIRGAYRGPTHCLSNNIRQESTWTSSQSMDLPPMDIPPNVSTRSPALATHGFGSHEIHVVCLLGFVS